MVSVPAFDEPGLLQLGNQPCQLLRRNTYLVGGLLGALQRSWQTWAMLRIDPSDEDTALQPHTRHDAMGC